MPTKRSILLRRPIASVGVAVLALLVGTSICGSWNAKAGVEHAISLPITFSDSFQDDDQRSIAVTPASAGTPGFDSNGNAYYRDGAKLHIVPRTGRHAELDFYASAVSAIKQSNVMPAWDGQWDGGQMVDDRIVFDMKDHAYTILTPRYSNLKQAVLLYSTDKCKTWHAVLLEGRSARLEVWDSFNSHDGPPTAISFENYGKDRGTKLWLHTFKFDKGRVQEESTPALISDNSLLVLNHSGGANSTFTVGNKIFVVYPSSKAPAGGRRGTEVLMRQYDRSQGAFEGAPISLGVAGDIAKRTELEQDPHNIPAITADKNGRLYVVFGSHHGALKLTSSRMPLSVHGGWDTPTLVDDREGASYTYAAVITDKDQNLHIVSRMEGEKYRFKLVQFSKPLGEPFRHWEGGLPARVLVDPGRPFYVAWRQRLALDRDGNLYVHFKYWPNQLNDTERAFLKLKGKASKCRGERCFYMDAPYKFPTTLVSRDNGVSFSVFSAGQ